MYLTRNVMGVTGVLTPRMLRGLHGSLAHGLYATGLKQFPS